jgi:hypothetical protein
VDDRKTTDGAKVLFAEELQSDWHQAGRRHGYADSKTRAEEDAKLNQYVKAQAEATAERSELVDRFLLAEHLL